MEKYVSYHDFHTLLEDQPWYVIFQCVVFLGALVTFKHGRAGFYETYQNGGVCLRYWFSVIFNSIFIEVLCFTVSPMTTFWHSKTAVMIFKYIPIYIPFLYVCIYYQAFVAASYMRVGKHAKPIIIGLLATLLDVPFETMASKFLFYTFHDSEPNYKDRLFNVPHANYLFHLIFSSVIYFIISDNVAGKDQPKKRSKFFHLLTPFKSVFFVFISFFVLNSIASATNISLGFLICTIYVICAALAWSADTEKIMSGINAVKIIRPVSLILHLIAHFGICLTMALFGHPERSVSGGYHQPVGPCNQVEYIRTLGQTTKRFQYVCANETHHFTIEGPAVDDPASESYPIRGTPFENRPEYVYFNVVVALVAFIIFKNIYSRWSNVKLAKHTK